MIPRIKKILYATDLSASASHAFGYAIRIALNENAKISIINVCEKLTNNTNIKMRSNDFATAKNRLTEIIRSKLDQYFDKEKSDDEKEQSDECQFSKFIENVYITSGMPVESIIAQAETGGYDLIVMGTHGHGFLYSALIGSTAQKMVQQSKIPALVVRLQD